MKSSQKLDYHRLAEHLIDRGLIDRETMQHVLQQCTSTGALLPEILVRESLVSDWEVSRVCCELFHLPYLPVESYSPSQGVLDGLEPDYLRQFGLVPLDRFGDLLTVAMPGIVPSGVLEGMVSNHGVRVLAVVGSVSGNRHWLDEHLPAPKVPSLEAYAAALPAGDDSWAGIFDAGDEAVQLELQDRPIELDPEA